MKLIGILPEDVVEVELKGARFTIGTVPGNVWQRIQTSLAIAHQNAKRNAIAALTAAGVNPGDPFSFADEKPEEKPDEKKTRLTIADMRAMQDPEYVDSQARLQLEGVCYALRDFSAIADRKGNEIKCERSGERITKRLEQILAVNPELVQYLWQNGVHKLNTLEEEEKKA